MFQPRSDAAGSAGADAISIFIMSASAGPSGGTTKVMPRRPSWNISDRTIVTSSLRPKFIHALAHALVGSRVDHQSVLDRRDKLIDRGQVTSRSKDSNFRDQFARLVRALGGMPLHP